MARKAAGKKKGASASPAKKKVAAKLSSTAGAARGLAKRVVKRAITAVTGALDKHKSGAAKKPVTKAAAARTTKGASVKRPTAKASRAPRREPDIALDRIAGTYTPTQTSLKTGFRTTGADHERDQEFAGGVDDNRWRDEDRLTNKSGDPRIGTHGRTYEPGEKRTKRAAAASSDEDTE